MWGATFGFAEGRPPHKLTMQKSLKKFFDGNKIPACKKHRNRVKFKLQDLKTDYSEIKSEQQKIIMKTLKNSDIYALI